MFGVGRLVLQGNWRRGLVALGAIATVGLAGVAFLSEQGAVDAQIVAAVTDGAGVQTGEVQATTVVLDDDEWMASVRRRFERRSRVRSQNYVTTAPQPRIVYQPPSGLGAWFANGMVLPGFAPPPITGEFRSASLPYRTVCVRLCDGYYFPISAATTSNRFRRDEQSCESQCQAPTKLYYYPVNGDPSQMVDRNGQAYSKLRTAFLYRTSYNQACTCRAHPWEAESKTRHKIYALNDERKSLRGDRSKRREIAREIKELKQTVADAQKTNRTEAKSVTRDVLNTASKEEQAERVDRFTVTTTATAQAFEVPERAPATRRVIDVGDSGGNVAATATPAKKAHRYKPKMLLGSAGSQPSGKVSAPRTVRQRSWKERAFNRD